MRALGFEYRESRHTSTPAYNGLEDGTPTEEEADEEQPKRSKGK